MEISIKSIEKKQAKTGKTYWIVETSEGKMSIWDSLLAKDIEEKCIGKFCDVEIEKTGKYTNLKLVNKVIGSSSFEPANKGTAGEAIGESAKAKRKAEMMTCAKDIVSLSYDEKEDNTDSIENRIAHLTNLTKIVWYDLMRTIGEPVDDLKGGQNG
jgi:hypothetical protein